MNAAMLCDGGKRMDKKELDFILEKHKKWLNDENDGERANLRGADLRYAGLQDADLQDADLRSGATTRRRSG